jgi:hypothetical protein
MRSRFVIIFHIQVKDIPQVPLAVDDDMVKTFPAERPNQPFRMPILPG